MGEYEHERVNALLYGIREGDNYAFNTLVEQYSPMLRTTINRLGLDSHLDEAFSEACIGLFKAAKTFNTEQDKVTFGLYARVCVTRALYDLIRSIDRNASNYADVDVEKIAVTYSIADAMAKREERDEFIRSVRNLLSDFEFSVFHGWLLGNKTALIASMLGTSAKSVDNAKARIIRKLRDGLKPHQN